MVAGYVLAAGASPAAAAPRALVAALSSPPADARPLAMQVGARTLREGDDLLVQWPGAWFEAAFSGPSVLFRLGAGEARWQVRVDGAPVATLLRPAAGWQALTGLAPGPHAVRVELMSEQQGGPARFGGFALPAGGEPLAPPRRVRQVEFIGDSHTVGYGNASPVRECSADDVWRTTDTTRAFGPLLARRWDADFHMHAISGRGVVRNYDGFAAATLPEAYGRQLPGQETPAATAAGDDGWQPQVLVVALGTNDFSTPLHAGERWTDRDALHADFESTYVRFVQSLRARHPQADILLWATDMANGEIDAEARKVAMRLQEGGDRRIAYVPVQGLAFSGCHFHPSLADDELIAARLEAALARLPAPWPAAAATTTAAAGDSRFVAVREGRFVLDGKPLRYVGANLWYAAWLGSTDPSVGDRARLVRELDALAALGVTNLRILGAAEASPLAHSMSPAISERGQVVDERLLEGLDFALAEMARRHMKAVVYLNNFWEWSGGMVTYQYWVNGGRYFDMGDPAHPWPAFAQQSARFYADAQANALYRDYLRTLLGRRNTVTGVAYADDPTVMAWQLANEPRPGEGVEGEANLPAFRAWIRDTTATIRSLAPRQLVSLGSEGAMGCIDSDACLEQAYQGTGIDYMTFHLWPTNWGWFDPRDAAGTIEPAMRRSEAYLQRHIALASRLGLPLVLEEFGLDREGGSYEPGSPTASRDRLYSRIYALQAEQQRSGGPLAGSNFWAWGGEGRARHPDHRWQAGDHALVGDPPHEPQGWYSVFTADASTLAVVRKAACTLAAGPCDEAKPRH